MLGRDLNRQGPSFTLGAEESRAYPPLVCLGRKTRWIPVSLSVLRLACFGDVSSSIRCVDRRPGQLKDHDFIANKRHFYLHRSSLKIAT